jgi:hypothetical protein
MWWECGDFESFSALIKSFRATSKTMEIRTRNFFGGEAA